MRILLIFLALLLIAVPAYGAAPVLRSNLPSWTTNTVPEREVTTYQATHYNLLLVYIGEGDGDRRVHVWSTQSTSPNATIGPPWDEVGERLETFAVWQFDLGGGWVVVPLERRKIEVSRDVWVEDAHVRFSVWVSAEPGCPVAACGAVRIVPRTDLDDVVSVNPKRRAVR